MNPDAAPSLAPSASPPVLPAERDLLELGRFCRHDLVEPIRTIAIGLDLLDTDDVDADERETLTTYLQSSVRSLDAVARRLNEYLRLSSPQPAPLELDDIVRTASAETAIRYPMAPLEIDAEPATITADPILICDVFTELFDNVARHGTAEAPRSLRLEHELVAGEHRIRVCEPGAQPWGADPTLIELFRASRAGGPGVGLAICRRIAELHGGHLRLIDAADGPGVEVTFAS